MKKATFANLIISLCLIVSIAITVSVVYEYHRLDTVMPSGVLVALLGLWGGELLIIAIRQILGSDVISKRNSSYHDIDDSGSI